MKTWNVQGLIALTAMVLPLAAHAATPYADGQVIVRFKSEADPSAALKRINANASIFVSSEPLVQEINLHLVKLKPGVSVSSAIQALKSSSEILYSQADHKVTQRAIHPNDPKFSDQWHLQNIATGADIRATEAWARGTGGRNPDGKDIVVAVVDGGMDIKHVDLAANAWTNSGETPANGVDDDGNGYIDDVNGWNAYTSTGKIPANDHGTHVSGIIGAVGDNSTGVSGINWNVKIMSVAASSSSTSTIAKGYGYVLAMKKLWLESGGAKGANVVATNSSFGVDYAKCDSGSYPVWNDLYTSMGQVGILSAAATANANVDVDVKGDVPTGCSSPYLITVTNTDKTDKKNSSAGYGKTTIDLGAPGTSVFSTVPGNAYRSMTGTSMSTPNVAGSVAFLHSVASSAFQARVNASPGEASLELKRVLLENTDPIPSMAGITVSGGRLNLARAAEAMAGLSR